MQTLVLGGAVAGGPELHGEAADVDAVSGGVPLVGNVSGLEEVRNVVEDGVIGERQVLGEDGLLFIPLGEVDHDLRLQTGVDVLGQLECGSIIVHRGGHAEAPMSMNLDAGNDGFDVTAIIEQGRERCPAFLAHAVAFVEYTDAASDHGCHERRGDIAKTAFAFDDRRDQQVFRAGVERRLHDIDVAAHLLGRGVGEGRLPDAGLAEQPRRHGYVVLVDGEPSRLKLADHFLLADPSDRNLIGMGEIQSYAFHIDGAACTGVGGTHVDYSIVAKRA